MYKWSELLLQTVVSHSKTYSNQHIDYISVCTFREIAKDILSVKNCTTWTFSKSCLIH